MRGLIIAAPNSGAGKTTITLGLLRAFRARDIAVASAKSGPDYIDPQFHRAASGTDCGNLDAWAMPPAQLRGLAAAPSGELLIVEGAMGLFDGAPDPDPMGRGSVADLAETLNLPVVLVLDAAKQSQTAAAIVYGLANLRPAVRIAGVILNRMASERHIEGITRAIATLDIPVLGAIPRSKTLETPSRHLGLVQAFERPDLERFLDEAAQLVTQTVNLDALATLAEPVEAATVTDGLPPLGQRIAIARDEAFAFAYPHMLRAWQQAGAELSFFSPLADEGPAAADAVFLPGGYPELHAGRLAANINFAKKMTTARDSGTVIYGECGGYMTLGERLIDADGASHNMLGFLPVTTSFAKRKLHLGYRHLTPLCALPWEGPLRGHEFHYASIISEGRDHVFEATDSMKSVLPDMGQIFGRVMGSFAHVIAAN